MPTPQQQINYGNTANDGQGDPLRTAFIKTDDNFDAIWAAGPVGSNITVLNNTVQAQNTNGNITLSPNGIGTINVTRPVIPTITNAHDLGAANSRFRTVWAGSGGVNSAGNISASYFIGDGSLLTGLPEGYGNANVANLLPVYTGDISANVINASGNISAAYFIGDGSLLTGLPEGYGNADVAAYLPTYTGNLAGSRIVIENGVGNAWTIAGNSIFAPSGGEWRSKNDTLDDFITSAANGYINLQSLFENGSIASELKLEHGVARLVVANEPFKEWTFRNTGVLEAPGNITAQNFVGGTINDPVSLANLTTVAGARAFINDGNLSAAGNFGVQIGGGGSNVMPVWSDGVQWYVG